MNETPEQKRPYIQVFVVLAVLTAIEVGVASLDIGNTIRIIALLAFAVAKAVLVALFYMHLRYDHRLLAIIGAIPVLLIGIMLVIQMADRVSVIGGQ